MVKQLVNDVPVHLLNDPAINSHGVKIHIKREDLIHPAIPGNKWWKLKHNLSKAKKENKKLILTFGGAYSNHIAATAAAGRAFGFNTIGIIRGEASASLNPTLNFAQEKGMHLHYISRSAYKEKHTSAVLDELKRLFGDFFIIPEGGANKEGVLGCAEMLKNVATGFDYICCPCGTGTTLAGITLSLKDHQHALGFSSLKGGAFLHEEVASFIQSVSPGSSALNKYSINTDYHFGGYAQIAPELIAFIKGFKERTGIQLDAVYTGKMMYGIYDLLRKGFWKKDQGILVVHTGGIQGNSGIGERYGVEF